MDYSQLPSTFYRVSIKALVFNERRELLVFCDNEGKWELPGGGWDYPESLDACVRRELDEEVKAKVIDVGGVVFTYFCESEKGYHKLCLAVPTTIDNRAALRPSGDNLVEARYVSKDEFLTLPFQTTEAGVTLCLEQIWPA